MNRHSTKRGAVVASLLTGLALCAVFGPVLAQDAKEAAAPSKYIGAAKCKNCHSSEESGNQYGHWEKSGHAKAWAALASDEAKKIAKEKGIEDPQKSDKCVKCHETAFGVAEADIKKGFDIKAGVQCETCHGPGENHMKVRFAAAATAKKGERQTVPAGEIGGQPDAKLCTGCHNSESPTFKGFCIHERNGKIQHLDPRKDQTGEKLICGCDAKEGCKHVCDDKCGGKK